MAGESQQVPESVPDPTVLTTEAISRATKAERDYVDGKFDVLQQRLSGMDEATRVLNETVTKTPTEIQKEVMHLRELSDEKFASVSIQFKERDVRQEREARDNKVAVDAALSAQKESASKQDEANQKSIDKSERAAVIAMDKLAELVNTKTEALSNQITDLKERVDRTEGKSGGFNGAMGAMMAVAVLVVAIISVLANVLTN